MAGGGESERDKKVQIHSCIMDWQGGSPNEGTRLLASVTEQLLGMELATLHPAPPKSWCPAQSAAGTRLPPPIQTMDL